MKNLSALIAIVNGELEITPITTSMANEIRAAVIGEQQQQQGLREITGDDETLAEMVERVSTAINNQQETPAKTKESSLTLEEEQSSRKSKPATGEESLFLEALERMFGQTEDSEPAEHFFKEGDTVRIISLKNSASPAIAARYEEKIVGKIGRVRDIITDDNETYVTLGASKIGINVKDLEYI